MRLVLEVVADKCIIVLVLVGKPYQRVYPYVCGNSCLAVPEVVVMSRVVGVRAVDIYECLDAVLLALLHHDVEDLHTVNGSLAVFSTEIRIDSECRICVA